VGTEERENEIRMVPVFKHTHEASIPHIHSLRGNIPLALGNRHHLRSGFSTFPLAFGNAYRPTTTFRPSLTRSMSELAILQQLRRAHFHQVLNIVSADALCLLHLPSLLSIECGEPALKSTRSNVVNHYTSPAVGNSIGAVPHKTSGAIQVLNAPLKVHRAALSL
jgi:hypothetical protein